MANKSTKTTQTSVRMAQHNQQTRLYVCDLIVVHTYQPTHVLRTDNHGSGYLGMAKGFQCTRQISGYLSRILSQL